MMLEDEDYNESIANIIDTQQVNAEYAVAVTSDNFAEMFAAMDDRVHAGAFSRCPGYLQPHNR